MKPTLINYRSTTLKWALALLFSVLVLLWALFVSGCGPNKATFTPAPRSSENLTSVMLDAIAWANRDPARRFWSPVAATHSMEPFVNEHSIILCLRYVPGQPIANGAVAVYRYSDKSPRVLHVVSDQNETHVYMSGFNNHDSDGWQPKTAIEGFVVGQLYTP